MILYIEKQAKNYFQTEKIIKCFKNPSIIFIDNYKNIFDKNLGLNKVEKSLIIAKLKSNSVGKLPPLYGHIENSYFFKTSINCIFDCSYCFLKGAFKNNIMTFFVNYEDIKNEIKETIKKNNDDKIWFYSSDYSDILGMNNMSGFIEEFVPFFENFENTMMEIRTKSSNIKPILDLGFIPKNTEFSFSLNPQILITKYEKGSASLEDRINAINKLLEKGFKVGLRFLPLLPVKNYYEIYEDFVKYIGKNINLKKIFSTFASGLLYTKEDYNTIIKKNPDLDILYMLEDEKDGFFREPREFRDNLYKMFKNLDEKCFICLDNKLF